MKPLMLRTLLISLFIALAGTAAAASQDVGQRLNQQGVLLTIMFVFGAGVLVSLTPCLYPMIPITLSVIGARAVGQKPLFGFLRALSFVLGIAVVYSGLGMVAVTAGLSISFILQYKLFWLILSLFFVAMGVSMLGAFTIQLPASFTGKLQGATAGKGGYVGAFLIGVVTGVAASPCGSPVLASLIAFGSGNPGRPVLIVTLFFAYALGMGLLFLILGTFPSMLKTMPKSGGWMDDVKKLLGLVIIGVGVYYLQNAMRDHMSFYWILVIVLSLATAAYVAIKSSSRKQSPGLLLGWRITGVALAAIGIYAAAAKFPATLKDIRQQASVEGVSPDKLMAEGRDLLLDDGKFAAMAKQGSPSPKSVPAANDSGNPANADAAPKNTQGEWLSNETQALALAKESGKPVIIDFGAAWCAACKELEHKTFPDPKVAEALKNFVLLRIDCTGATPENEALQKKYKAFSLPTVAFVDKTGAFDSTKSLYAFEKPADFLERLNQFTQ